MPPRGKAISARAGPLNDLWAPPRKRSSRSYGTSVPEGERNAFGTPWSDARTLGPAAAPRAAAEVETMNSRRFTCSVMLRVTFRRWWPKIDAVGRAAAGGSTRSGARRARCPGDGQPRRRRRARSRPGNRARFLLARSRSPRAPAPGPGPRHRSTGAARPRWGWPPARCPARRRQEVDLAQEHEVGLGDLTVEDVGHLVGEGEGPSCYFREAVGLDEHGQRGQGKSIAEESAQGPVDGGREVGAASHRLRQQDVDGRGFDQAAGRLDELVEAATETAARDLLRGQAERAEEGRVHEVPTLVVGDEPDLVAASEQLSGGGGQGRRLARSEEAADAAEEHGRHGARALPYQDGGRT